jgi:pimeloyl-ACP methyl ester carboxylesterase
VAEGRVRGATRSILLANAAAVIAAVTKKRAGDAIAVVVRRGNETFTKETTLAPQPLERQADYDVEYGSVDAGGAKRRVIVTRPRGAGKHPAVLFLGGIGCYPLDGLLRPPELRAPYAKILDALTRAGYVTMRVEKSGMGDSEGPPCMDPRADFDAEVRGYAAGLERLESFDFVDAHNVFFFAHSIGPLAAARIAAGHPVRGIAVAETIGTGWMEYDLTNIRRQLLLGGMPYDEVDRRMRRHEVCAHGFFIEKQTPDAACVAEIPAPQPYTYMQQVASVDLGPLWKKIDAPALLFYGTADFITDRHQHEYLRDMIDAFHPGHATYVEIEGMDHSLTLAGTQKASFEGKADAPFAQRVVDETLRFFDRLRRT